MQETRPDLIHGAILGMPAENRHRGVIFHAT